MDSLRLGAACGWFSEGPVVGSTEDKAISYPVIGLPEDMTAMVTKHVLVAGIFWCTNTRKKISKTKSPWKTKRLP